MLAIIGGSGLTQLANLDVTRREIVRTPHGEPSGALTFGTIDGREVVFLARHGYGHTIPPHEVNYRANIWALHAVNVTDLVSVAIGRRHPRRSCAGHACGSRPDHRLYARAAINFFHARDHSVTHIDFTHPYCEAMRQRLLEAARGAGEAIVAGGTYAATQGPRLETAAEIDRLERDGADMVGMTGMPEAALAREIGAVLRRYRGRGQPCRGSRRERNRNPAGGHRCRSRSGRPRGCTRSWRELATALWRLDRY